MDLKVKELIKKVTNTSKKTRVIAAICAVATICATLIAVIAAKRCHSKSRKCDGNCDGCCDETCENYASCHEDEAFPDAIKDGSCKCDGKCKVCPLGGNTDNEEVAKMIPVGVVFMDSTNASMYEKASKCENYDSDFSGGYGNCSSNATSGEGICETVGANCMCVQCALNLVNGGPCTHCQKCPGAPLTKNSEEEKSEEVTE